MDNEVKQDGAMFTRVSGTVQDLISEEVFKQDKSSNNEMLELMDFMRLNGVPMSENQVQASFLLAEMGLSDIAIYANSARPVLTPAKVFYDLINKLTLADRIKGNVKLDKIMKATVASPSQNVPNGEVTPKAMKESELPR